jgi:hypothetical protein
MWKNFWKTSKWMTTYRTQTDKRRFQLSCGSHRAWQVMNASVSRFYFNSRGIFLAGFNDIYHLLLKREPSLLTYR